VLIIAERINATRKRIARALREKDEQLIAAEARLQTEAGADFIDVNAGANPSEEVEGLAWAVGVVQQSTDLPVCVDSAGVEGLRAALAVLEHDDVMINSINGEQGKMESILPLAVEHNARIVALTMDETGMPRTVDDRLRVAGKILERAEKAGLLPERFYFDPCIQPLSTSPDQAEACLEAVRRIKQEFPGVHTTCGLSNVSFGLPRRSLINRTFLIIMAQAGLDSVILDPTEKETMAALLAAEALCGRDEFCMNYITAARSGKLDP